MLLIYLYSTQIMERVYRKSFSYNDARKLKPHFLRFFFLSFVFAVSNKTHYLCLMAKWICIQLRICWVKIKYSLSIRKLCDCPWIVLYYYVNWIITIQLYTEFLSVSLSTIFFLSTNFCRLSSSRCAKMSLFFQVNALNRETFDNQM